MAGAVACLSGTGVADVWTALTSLIAAKPIGRLFNKKPAVANSMMQNSNTLTPMVTVRLLLRSARKPPAIENKMNGSENNAVVNGKSALCQRGDRARLSPKNVTSVFSALSENAPWNCVTMRLQNPRRQFGCPVPVVSLTPRTLPVYPPSRNAGVAGKSQNRQVVISDK